MGFIDWKFTLIFMGVTGCNTNQAGAQGKKEADKKDVELTISSAASLQDALNDIKVNFEKEQPNVNIIYNFGASGSLQQQISQGAPADIFFSAAEDKFQKLVQDGQIDKKNETDLVGNELVLVVPIFLGSSIIGIC